MNACFVSILFVSQLVVHPLCCLGVMFSNGVGCGQCFVSGYSWLHLHALQATRLPGKRSRLGEEVSSRRLCYT